MASEIPARTAEQSAMDLVRRVTCSPCIGESGSPPRLSSMSTTLGENNSARGCSVDRASYSAQHRARSVMRVPGASFHEFVRKAGNDIQPSIAATRTGKEAGSRIDLAPGSVVVRVTRLTVVQNALEQVRVGPAAVDVQVVGCAAVVDEPVLGQHSLGGG